MKRMVCKIETCVECGVYMRIVNCSFADVGADEQ